MGKPKLLHKISEFLKLITYKYAIGPLDQLLLGMIAIERGRVSRIYRGMLAWLKDFLWLLQTRGRVEVLCWDGEQWSVLYIHDGSVQSKSELKYLLFPAAPVETFHGRFFLWQVSDKIKEALCRNCLVVCDLNRLIRVRLRARFCFRVPPWLRATLDISMPLAQVKGRMTRTYRSRIPQVAKRGLCYKFSHEPEDIRLFYNEMYLPSVVNRFGSRAVIGSLESKIAIFNRGGLLLVQLDGRSIAALLMHIRGKTMIAASFGIHPASRKLRKRIIFDALYWYSIEWAHSQGLQAIDFGMTRSRLFDGGFEHKRQIGNRFERDILTPTMWNFLGDSLPVGLIRRLNDLALIAEVDYTYRCVAIDADASPGLTEDERARRVKMSTRAGLGDILLLK